MNDRFTPSTDDRFSFGMWTVGLAEALAAARVDQLAMEHLLGVR